MGRLLLGSVEGVFNRLNLSCAIGEVGEDAALLALIADADGIVDCLAYVF